MWKDMLRMHFIVFLWGFTAIIGAVVTLPALELTLWRTGLSAVAFFGLLLYKGRRVWVGWSAALALLGLGCLVATHWTLFFAAAKVANASVCLAGIACGSLFVAFLEPLFLRSRVKLYEVFLGVAVLSGLLVVASSGLSPKYLFGLALALGAAFVGAVFSTLNGVFVKRFRPMTITFYTMLGAALFCVASLPLYQAYLAEGGRIRLLPAEGAWAVDAPLVAVLALVCTVYAYYASVELLQRISVFASVLVINLEPIYGFLLAAALLHEHEQLTPRFYLGAGVIVVAVLSYPLIVKAVQPR